MPVLLNITDTVITREDIRNPKDPWRSCRKVDLSDVSLERATDAELRRWLEQAGPYLESVDACDFFCTYDRISLFWLEGGTRTPYLKELDVWLPSSETPDGAANTLADVLLLALNQAPALEKLTITDTCFSSPGTIEHFLAGSKTLTYLRLDRVKVVFSENSTKADAVASAFRRGIQRNQTLTSINVLVASDGVQERILRGVLLGIAKNKHIQELKLDVHGDLVSEHTLTAIQFLFTCLPSAVRNVTFSGSIALVALFQGMSSCTANVNELTIKNEGYYIAEPPDLRLASAVREWHESRKTITSLVCRGGQFGPESGVALAETIAQMVSLKNLSIEGDVVSSLDPVFRHMGLLQSVKLDSLKTSPNWTSLDSGIQRQQQRFALKEFQLTHSLLALDDIRILLRFLGRIKCLEIVCMNGCGITAEGSALFVPLIQQTNLKTLDLTWNPVGTQGAKTILEAAQTSTSMERLLLNTVDDDFAPDVQFCINECHGALGNLLRDSRLVDLWLSSDIAMNRETVQVLANGLRQNTSLKTIKVPYIRVEDLFLLAGSLVENSVVDTLHVGPGENVEFDDSGQPVFGMPDETQEHCMSKFIDLLPQMTLKNIDCLFDRKPTERLTQRLIAAMRLNTFLEDVRFDYQELPSSDLFSNEVVQYYLELNRLNRRQYLGSIGDKTLPSSLLPSVLARMTRPEFSSHLFYFLQHGAGLLQSPTEASSSTSLKRKAASLDDDN